ncbi:MAG: hypothetical protein CRN43_06495, partial [Candidatus Nephrothrix sp. EaCA]
MAAVCGQRRVKRPSQRAPQATQAGGVGAGHLKKSFDHLQPSELKTIYTFITDEMKGQFPIQQVCKTLGVNRSAYYDFAKGKTCQAPDASLMKEVYEVFMDNRRRCGSRRVHAELRTKGKIIGRHQVRKLLKQQGLQAIQPKSFVPKTTN